MRHRISQLIFSLFILLATLSLPLFAQAGEVTASGSGTLNTTAVSNESIPIMVAYEEVTGEDTSPVYQVQIQWGSLKFYCQKINAQVWSPSSLSYTGASTGYTYKWICPTDGETRNDQVIVTNRSNRAITCNLSLEKNTADNVSGTSVSLDVSSHNLPSAVGATEGTLQQGVTTVSVSGEYTGEKAADAGYLHISIVPVASE
jgi:hypothetical protein